ncbi:hypothetical protein DOM22_02790 [Bdellovibrio sp. ZAP7]|nr:hypothetical protein DOM22_02790 [Bdellovibrio sp. ZAP7]
MPESVNLRINLNLMYREISTLLAVHLMIKPNDANFGFLKENSMKTLALGLVLLASTAASAATKCVAVTERMNLKIVQKEDSVGVLYSMNPRDLSKYGKQFPGLTISFQEGEVYDIKGTTVDGLVNNKDVLTKLVVNAIYSTAFFGGEEDMAYVEAGDLIKALKCE